MTNNKINFKDIPIIFEHNDFIAINKPYGIASQGGTNISSSIDSIFSKKNGSDFDYKLVHRLDKHTTGILILAKYKNAANKLGKLFFEHKINKTYIALVKGNLKNATGSIDFPLQKTSKLGKEIISIKHRDLKNFKDAKEALTYYEMIDYAHNYTSLLKLTPISGRKHQLRVHLSAIGNPIIGDGKYGGKNAFINELSNKLHLHCGMIEFTFKGKKITIKSDLPEYFKEDILKFGLNFKIKKL